MTTHNNTYLSETKRFQNRQRKIKDKCGVLFKRWEG